ncbi:hypothetical protein [Nocardioides sp. SYSU DS0651]|uniref:hypothetical protein n=1 Tax=Nocardioides sp. SYSU DS0651 TaxID=3415955 RepID=UPI003F4B2B61
MSTARRHPDDRGLAAVARVREVRETDSRIGLQRVLADEAAVVARLTDLESRLQAAPTVGQESTSELLGRRAALAGAGVLIQESRADAALAAGITAEARVRWGADKARLSAVEHLLDRRAARRRTDAQRRADREADDIAAQRWARERAGSHTGHDNHHDDPHGGAA